LFERSVPTTAGSRCAWAGTEDGLRDPPHDQAALADALRRGLVTRNVAVVARAPKQRSLQRIEGVSLTEEELRQLMRTAVGHRLFPLLWLTAMTGMRRDEVLGLKWPDIDFAKKRLQF
jgi:integrase